ncbi:MAG: hypothetical protein K2Q26_12465 [Bdellovibrionales bacterium]|nr:hypothetical protein [Bdellovibrionales bacterium]
MFNKALKLFILAVSLVTYTCSWAEDKGKSATCAVGTQVDGFFSIKKGITSAMFEKPDKKSKRVVNRAATEFLGKIEYREVNPDYKLRAKCQQGEWLYAQIVRADEKEVAWESGWIPKSKTTTLSAVEPAKNLAAKDVDECISKGIRYFKGLKSYPILSDGRNSELVAKERCLRTKGAFDSSNDLN